MIRLVQIPFIPLSLALIIGVLIADAFQSAQLSLFVPLLLLIGSLILSLSIKGKMSIILLILAFISIGSTLLLLKRGDRQLILQNDPQFVIGEVIEVRHSKSDWNTILFEVEAIPGEKKFMRSNELLLLKTAATIHTGDVLLARIEPSLIYSKGNPGEFDLKEYYKGKNIRFQAFMNENDYRLLEHRNSLMGYFNALREGAVELVKRYFPDESHGLAIAILLGDKSYLDPETYSIFQDAGAMHVLAVSGLHVGIVMLLLSYLFQRASRFITKRTAIILTLVLTFIYAGITGFSPSVVRSFIMFGVILIGQLMSWESNTLNSLGFAGVVLLLINPLLIYDLGFQLSFLAMLGIILLYSKVERLFYVRNKFARKIWQGTALGIAAQIATLPLALYHFGKFPNYFWLSNLLVMIFAGIILGLGLSFLVLGRISFMAKMMGMVIGLLISLFTTLTAYIGDLPYAVASGFSIDATMLMILYIMLSIGLILMSWKGKRPIIFLGAVVALIVVQTLRLNNLIQHEVVVFNSEKPCVLKRSGKYLTVFYGSNGDRKQVDRLVSDFNKKLNMDIKFVPMKLNERYAVAKESFSIAIDEEGSWFLDHGKRKYYIVQNYRQSYISDRIPIKMAYLPVFSEDEISLRNGAFRSVK